MQRVHVKLPGVPEGLTVPVQEVLGRAVLLLHRLRGEGA